MPAEDSLNVNRIAVDLRKRIAVLFQDRAAELNTGEEPAGVRVREDLGRRGRIRFGLCGFADRPGSGRGVGPDREALPKELGCSPLGHHKHHEIRRFDPNLEASAAACDPYETGGAPTRGSTATHHAISVPAPYDEGGADHRWDEGNASRTLTLTHWNLIHLLHDLRRARQLLDDAVLAICLGLCSGPRCPRASDKRSDQDARRSSSSGVHPSVSRVEIEPRTALILRAQASCESACNA
jgi:hypothetical protein